MCFVYRGTRALEEGESCRFQKEAGVCLGYSKCRPVLESLGGRIKICTYNAKEAVVCCPRDYQDRLEQLAQEDVGISVSAKKCKEYMRQATPLLIFSSLKPNAEVTQKRGKSCSTDNKLIVGGEVAKLGEFPHMAAIGYQSEFGSLEFRCGGSLISDRYVLTAAHCRNGEASIVRLGDLDLKSDKDGAQPEDYGIEEFVKHPEYKARTKYNDVALVKLGRTVQFSQMVRPACLYQSMNVKEQKLIATGFGATENFGASANVLLKVPLEQFSLSSCQQQYQNDGRPLIRGIINSQLCAGYQEGGRDTCQGDSGGPLQVRDSDNDCLFYVAAVTSFGKVCGSTVPGIYTRVPSFLNWIESVVWPSG